MGTEELRSWAEDAQARSRVLVADDDPDMRALLRDGLAAHGFEVLAAENGIDLIHKLDQAAREGGVDALVTDVRMPVLDGIDAVRHLRHWARTLPVFLISGFADVHASRLADLGATALLPKPVDLDDLARRVRDAIAFSPARTP